MTHVAQVLGELGLGDEDRQAWLASGLEDSAFGAWVTDRLARRPAGARARAVYGAPDVHDFARAAILEALSLRADDRLLEIGCGGGLLLQAASASGATLTGIDHSEEMVELARQNAPDADVRVAKGEELPFADDAFTAVAMSVVFLFFDDPLAVLHECRRVLAPAGRLASYTTPPEVRGTPAAPEPLASHTHFYSDDELLEIAAAANFRRAVVRPGQLLVCS